MAIFFDAFLGRAMRGSAGAIANAINKYTDSQMGECEICGRYFTNVAHSDDLDYTYVKDGGNKSPHKFKPV